MLSEIFTQGKLLETLRRNQLASDKTLRTTTGKIINGKTLQNMKIIKKFSPNEKNLKESVVQTELMKDFPPIYKERNPEVLAELITGYVKESGGIILDDETPDVTDEAPLIVREREPSLMMAQKLLVFRPRNPRRTSLNHPILTAYLLLLPREKEEKENPL